jgi:hypothetical protein
MQCTSWSSAWWPRIGWSNPCALVACKKNIARLFMFIYKDATLSPPSPKRVACAWVSPLQHEHLCAAGSRVGHRSGLCPASVCPVHARGLSLRDKRCGVRHTCESIGVRLQLLRGLAIQLSQGQGRQPRAAEGAPLAVGGRLSRAARAVSCGWGIIRGASGDVNPLLFPSPQPCCL